ncbi:hypothetical protein ACM5Q9_03675 [Advenella sp. RU8]|uniref:hypothetical protein n=1 Tax=Advenella sp. RU8 TaxID=3399575 RepID=UPI003AAE5813
MHTVQKIQILAGVVFFALVSMGFSVSEIAGYLNQKNVLTGKETLLLLVHGIWLAIWSLCIVFTLSLILQKKSLPRIAGKD